MTTRLFAFACLLGNLATTGCDLPAELDERPASAETLRPHWVTIVEGTFHSWHFDTDPTSGQAIDGVQLKTAWAMMSGVPVMLEALWVEDGTLHGIAGGLPIEGEDFIGSQWEVDMIVGGVAVPANHVMVDVLPEVDQVAMPERYVFVYEATGEALCPTDRQGDASAVVLADVHVTAGGVVMDRPSTLAWGCTAGAMGRSLARGLSLEVAGKLGLQASLRADAADYCGEGERFASVDDGAWVGYVWGPHYGPPGLPVEAGWGPDGATCIGTLRSDEVDPQQIPCLDTLPACGADPLADGAMLATWDWDAGDRSP